MNEKKKIETKKSQLIASRSLQDALRAELTFIFAEQEVAAQKVGRPKIGGPFKLTSQNGTEFTEQDLLGKFSLVYVNHDYKSAVKSRPTDMLPL